MGKRWPNVSSRSERSQSGGMGKQRRSVSSGSGSQPGQRKRKRRRKRHIVPPLNSLKSGRGREFFSVDSSVVPLPGDNVPPSIQMPEMLPTSFSGSQPGHPKQKRKRKRHIVPPLNSLKSGRGKEFFSVDSSLVTLQGDNAEPSMQICEKFPSTNGSEPGKAENGVRNKKRTFPLRSLKHRNNTIVSFNCSGVPFQGDGIDTSLQFSKSVPSEREMIHSNPKHSRRARRKDLSRVYIREDDHAAPVQVQQYFTSLDQNRKTSFLSTSGPNKEHFSVSFESAESNVVPSHEKVDSALANRKSTKRRHSKSSKKRGKDSCDIQHMTYSSLQPQSNIGSNHSSAIRVPERGKDSENTKGSDILGDTACLSDSITHVGKDATGDLALNNIGFLDKEKDYPPVLIERALRCPFRKKLLVLDLNGILCDVVFGSRGSCMPYKKVNSRSVFKRPFLDDFLAFCFERFVVGVWSSRNKKNIVGVIDYIMGDSKNKLLFCWDQSKCTVTGFNTIEKRHKPLVLKELIKLWNKEEASLPWVKGEYSPSNTLLVDDSPYKALCNPPHTAIFPFPYDFRDEDDSVLGPGGAVRVYLESISRADDVQEHVKEHSFGQHAVTSENKMWSFYKNIIDKINSVALTRL